MHLRSLSDLCGSDVWRKSVDQLSFLRSCFSKTIATLKMEQRNAKLVTPNTGLLTFSENIQMNFAFEK